MKNPRALIFLLFLAALAALSPLSIDMALPAQRQIAHGLRTMSGEAALTLSLFLAGFAGAPLVYGPLSDRYGRRPMLILGLVLFTAGSFAAASAPSILMLLLARLLQGMGAGAGVSMAFAMVRDLLAGAEARAKLSYIQMTTTVAPMIAPSLGALILGVGGWRSIYAALGLGGIMLLLCALLALPESHRGRDTSGSLFGGVVDGYRRLLTSRRGLGFALVFGLGFGVQFSYIAGSPLVFMGRFGLSARAYGLSFACTALGIMSGAFLNTRLARAQVPAAVPLAAGLCLFILTEAAMLVLVGSGGASTASLLPLLVLSALGSGIVGPNAVHGTLQAVPEISGTASAVLTSLQMSVAVIASAVVAAAFGRFGLYAMIVPMTGFSLAAAAVYVLMARDSGQLSVANRQ